MGNYISLTLTGYTLPIYLLLVLDPIQQTRQISWSPASFSPGDAARHSPAGNSLSIPVPLDYTIVSSNKTWRIGKGNKPRRVNFDVELAEEMAEAQVKFQPSETAPVLILAISKVMQKGYLKSRTYCCPRQLRGPREKLSSHLSSARPFSPSQRSGMNSSGFPKTSGLRWTK